MVQIHNFLNERAWDEVVKWEKRVDSCVFPRFLSRFPSKPFEKIIINRAGALSRETRRALPKGAILVIRGVALTLPFQVRGPVINIIIRHSYLYRIAAPSLRSTVTTG